MLIRIPTLLMLSSFFLHPCNSQAQQENFQVAFYNTENLFDTIDNPGKDDSEFLPDAKTQWNTERYTNKLNNLGRVILAMGNNTGPDLLGLCEVEDAVSLNDLRAKISNRQKQYNFVHFESTDPRGIDVALLYNTQQFKVLAGHPIRFELPNTNSKHTRDILYVKGELPNKQVLHVFVNHFPSRREGTFESAPKRQYVAAQLRQRVDSLLQKDRLANIVIMGDFNDEPGDTCMQLILKASCTQTGGNETGLFNCMCIAKGQGMGSHNYRRQWSMLDQIIISAPLLNPKNKIFYQDESATIYKQEWMLEQEEKYKGQPLRTYVGAKYLGGFSDHLPVYLYLGIK